MARFQALLKKTTHLDRLQPIIGLDLGSAQTKVVVDGKGVWHQPTVLAWHITNQTVMAIGEKAYHLAGKTPQMVTLIFPMREGVVADPLMITTYLELVLRQLHTQGVIKSLFHPRCRLAVPAGISPTEQTFLTRSIRQAGLMLDECVPKPLAIVRPHLRATEQVMGCIDIGYQTVEVGLFAGGEQVTTTTLRRLGTEQWITAIQQRMKLDHACDVGWQTAEKILKEVGGLFADSTAKPPIMIVRGRDMRTATITTVKVSGEVFSQDLMPLINDLLHEVRIVLDDAPSEVVTQSLVNGLVIAGAGAHLRGLTDVFKGALGGEVHISAHPETAVVTGLISSK